MREGDGRKLDHKTLEVLRMRAVRQIVDGARVEDVAAALDLRRSTVFGWMAKYRAGGWDALRERRAPGAARKLSDDQVERLYVLVVGRDPRQLQFDFALWTRDMVRQVIAREFGVELSRVSVGRLLRRMGLSPQRPVHRATEQDPEAVARWREQEYPAIRAEAEQVGARVYFGDEAGVRTDFHAGTTWAPVGETPVVESTGDRKSVSMISAVSPLGELHFDLVIGSVNSKVFIDFCRKLLDDDGGTVFLVVDNAPNHVSRAVREYVAGEDRLKIFYLPTYSPQLNPDEWVWKNVKHDRVGRSGIESQGHLYTVAREALMRLKETPEIVRGFFRDANLRYITAVH